MTEHHQRDINNHPGSNIFYYLTLGVSIISTIALIIFHISHDVNLQLTVFSLLFSILTLLILLLRPALNGLAKKKPTFFPYRNMLSFIVIYLLSLLTMIISWRLTALAGAIFASWTWGIAVGIKIFRFIVCAYFDIKTNKNLTETALIHNTCYEWQLLFIRLFIGLDLVPHFCEKLFAGSTIRSADITYFSSIGLGQYALPAVIIAGLIEFAGCFSLSCGFLTRLGSICLFLYLLIATILGHHFSFGFIWASAGGGWEYPVLWSTLILSFAFFGGDGFSFDFVIRKRTHLPRWIKALMGIHY